MKANAVHKVETQIQRNDNQTLSAKNTVSALCYDSWWQQKTVVWIWKQI